MWIFRPAIFAEEPEALHEEHEEDTKATKNKRAP